MTDLTDALIDKVKALGPFAPGTVLVVPHELIDCGDPAEAWGLLKPMADALKAAGSASPIMLAVDEPDRVQAILAPALEIVRDIAAMETEPMGEFGDCVLCDSFVGGGRDHEPTCPRRRAKELMGEGSGD